MLLLGGDIVGRLRGRRSLIEGEHVRGGRGGREGWLGAAGLRLRAMKGGGMGGDGGGWGACWKGVMERLEGFRIIYFNQASSISSISLRRFSQVDR